VGTKRERERKDLKKMVTRRTIMLTLLVGSCFTSVVFAADPNCRETYIVPGRAAMFEGSLSGLREAYTFFNAGVQDTNKCTGDKRELTFLHAVTETAMLFIDDSSIVGQHGFLYDGTSWTTLDKPGATETWLYGISDSNIVGEYKDASQNWHGFFYDGTSWTTLNKPGATGTVPYGISGSNIVGEYKDASQNWHGFLYNGTSWTTLNKPGATETWLYGISGSNIVGEYKDASQNWHGFFYNGTSWTTLNKPGAILTSPYGISGGNIVGRYWDASGYHGFLYNGTSWITLNKPGATGTLPYGISSGNIVGYYKSIPNNYHGFLYNGTSWTTLNMPGAIETFPYGIDGSNIVGGVSGGHSFLELAKGFGVEVLGDYFATLDINVPLTNGRYKIPSGADANKISDIIQNSILEIDDIIAELDSISDTAGNRFRIYFTPDETGLEKNLEVDYGEVLILRGLLLAFKSQLETKLAYDVFVDVNETLLDKLLYEDGVNPEEPNFAELAAIIGINDPCNININDDFLNHYLNLLKVLPTPGHPDANGAAILAKSKKDLLASIDSYFKAINYISAETDSQEDDLVYVDPNDKFLFDTVKQKLTALQNSLKNDTTATYPVETTKTYRVYSSSSIIGQMVLVYDLTGLGGESGSLTFTKPDVPTPWEVNWFGRDNSEIEVELECYSSEHWGDTSRVL